MFVPLSPHAGAAAGSFSPESAALTVSAGRRGCCMRGHCTWACMVACTPGTVPVSPLCLAARPPMLRTSARLPLRTGSRPCLPPCAEPELPVRRQAGQRTAPAPSALAQGTTPAAPRPGRQRQELAASLRLATNVAAQQVEPNSTLSNRACPAYRVCLWHGRRRRQPARRRAPAGAAPVRVPCACAALPSSQPARVCAFVRLARLRPLALVSVSCTSPLLAEPSPEYVRSCFPQDCTCLLQPPPAPPAPAHPSPAHKRGTPPC